MVPLGTIRPRPYRRRNSSRSTARRRVTSSCSRTARMPSPPPKASPALKKIPNSARRLIGCGGWSGPVAGWSSGGGRRRRRPGHHRRRAWSGVRLPAGDAGVGAVAVCGAVGQPAGWDDVRPHHVVVPVFQQVAVVHVAAGEAVKAVGMRTWNAETDSPSTPPPFTCRQPGLRRLGVIVAHGSSAHRQRPHRLPPPGGSPGGYGSHLGHLAAMGQAARVVVAASNTACEAAQ
jgi:hypothetical protein